MYSFAYGETIDTIVCKKLLQKIFTPAVSTTTNEDDEKNNDNNNNNNNTPKKRKVAKKKDNEKSSISPYLRYLFYLSPTRSTCYLS